MPIDDVKVVSGSDLVMEDTVSKIVRRHAVDEPDLWAGLSTIEGDVTGGWHHHGANTTVFYVLSGSLVVEFGPDGAGHAEVGPGDFALVPPNTAHREIVPPGDPVDAVVIRYGNGEGPHVIELDGPG